MIKDENTLQRHIADYQKADVMMACLGDVLQVFKSIFTRRLIFILFNESVNHA